MPRIKYRLLVNTKQNMFKSRKNNCFYCGIKFGLAFVILCLVLSTTKNLKPNYIHQNIPPPKSLHFSVSCMVVDHNFNARYYYGNKTEKGVRIIHWNKGPSYLINKKDEIECLIEQEKPHILGLSEANLHTEHINDVKFPDYNLHICPTIDNPALKVSRVVVYTHNSLVVKTRQDLMDDRISAVWLEVGLPHKQKFLVCNVYREWGYLNQATKISHSKAAQLDRWTILLECWERALKEGKEVILLGDINLNSLNWGYDDLPTNDTSYKLRQLVDLLFEKFSLSVFPNW